MLNQNIQCLWDQHSKLTRKIKRERAKSEPDANQLLWLQQRKKQIDSEIELVEGLVRTLARPTHPTGSDGAPAQLALT